MDEIPLSDSRLIALTCNSIINSIHFFSKILFFDEFVKFTKDINHKMDSNDENIALSLFLETGYFMAPQLIEDSLENKDVSKEYLIAWYKLDKRTGSPQQQIKRNFELQGLLNSVGNIGMLYPMLLMKNIESLKDVAVLFDSRLAKISFKQISFVHDLVPAVIKENYFKKVLFAVDLINDIKA